MAPYLNFKNKKHYNLSVFGIYFHIYYFAEKRERRSLSSYLHKTNFSFDVTCVQMTQKTVWEGVYVSLTVYVKNIASNTLGICVFCSLVTMKFPILIQFHRKPSYTERPYSVWFIVRSWLWKFTDIGNSLLPLNP